MVIWEQFNNAGDAKSLAEEMLVSAKEDIVTKNETQSAAIQDTFDRLFQDREGLARITEALTRYVYDFHTRPQAS